MNYNSEHIKTLTGLAPIMHSPEMYVNVSVADPRAHVQLMKEVIDNCIDEARANPNKRLKLNVSLRVTPSGRYQVCIWDNGRGIPQDKLYDSACVMHSSGKFKKGAYNGSIGTHGLGLKVVSALSRRMVAFSVRDNMLAAIQVINGVPGNLIKIAHKNGMDNSPTGTAVFYEVSPERMPNPNKYNEVWKLVSELLDFANATNPNMDIVVTKQPNIITDKFLGSENMVKVLESISTQGGLILYDKPNYTKEQYLKDVYGVDSREPLFKFPFMSKPYSFEEESFGIDAEIFIPKILPSSPRIVGSINGTPISHLQSAHMESVINVIKDKLSNHIADVDMRAFVCSKYFKIPLSGFISGKVSPSRLKFVGQNKSEYKSGEFIAEVTPYLKKCISSVTDEEWVWIYSCLEQVIAAQYSIYSRKTLVLNKGLTNINMSLKKPNSYMPCRSKDRTQIELLIAEGESAAGQLEDCRDGNTQAIFQLCGKFTNSIRAEKFTENDIISDLITILGVTPGESDLSNLNFARIGILTDADFDGYHITTLVLTALYKINPLILEHGHVFIANPPLYEFAVGRSNPIWLRDIGALRDVKISQVYEPNLELVIVNNSTKNAMVLEGEYYRDFVYAVLNLADTILLCSDSLVMRPEVLEDLVANWRYLKKGDYDTICRNIGMDAIIYNDTYKTLIMTRGGDDIQVQLDKLISEITMYILPTLRKFNFNLIECLVTTKTTDTYKNTPVSLMMLHKIFTMMDSVCVVDRLKGLGELSAEGLGFTCVDPNTRSVTTVTSVGDVDRLYQLMGSDVTARKNMMMTEIG